MRAENSGIERSFLQLEIAIFLGKGAWEEGKTHVDWKDLKHAAELICPPLHTFLASKIALEEVTFSGSLHTCPRPFAYSWSRVD